MKSKPNSKPPTRMSPTPWKRDLGRLEQMRGQSGAAAYDRVQLAMSIFDDADFRAETGCLDEFKAEAFFDPYFEDLCLTFAELKDLFRQYGDRAQWEGGKLRSMHAAMLEERHQSDEHEPRRTRWSITQAVHEKVKKEVTTWKGKATMLAARAASAETETQRLQDELAKAHERIAELEKENADLREALAACQEPLCV